MADKHPITAEIVRKLLHYDPKTGVFTWRERTGGRGINAWNARYAGKVAGSLFNHGYRMFRIEGRDRMAHRVAWLYMTGSWPPDGYDIDHIDRNKTNNRLANLRIATRKLNSGNQRLKSVNRTGFKGVCQRPSGRYQASIGVNRRQVYLGMFDTPEQAHAAYMEAAREHFGEFACSG